ncbi:hypothetical protein OH77DRAFT_1422376 [Trametes cingulata]|nr:hypothetical protein OH77DRAFT_1422376 [Trametes cingulata]
MHSDFFSSPPSPSQPLSSSILPPRPSAPALRHSSSHSARRAPSATPAAANLNLKSLAFPGSSTSSFPDCDPGLLLRPFASDADEHAHAILDWDRFGFIPNALPDLVLHGYKLQVSTPPRLFPLSISLLRQRPTRHHTRPRPAHPRGTHESLRPNPRRLRCRRGRCLLVPRPAVHSHSDCARPSPISTPLLIGTRLARTYATERVRRVLTSLPVFSAAAAIPRSAAHCTRSPTHPVRRSPRTRFLAYLYLFFYLHRDPRPPPLAPEHAQEAALPPVHPRPLLPPPALRLLLHVPRLALARPLAHRHLAQRPPDGRVLPRLAVLLLRGRVAVLGRGLRALVARPRHARAQLAAPRPPRRGPVREPLACAVAKGLARDVARAQRVRGLRGRGRPRRAATAPTTTRPALPTRAIRRRPPDCGRPPKIAAPRLVVHVVPELQRYDQ